MSISQGIRRVVCGVSGGVDSAVAAALLKRRGFEVIGAFMRNWDDQDEGGTCQITQENDYQDAKAVCDFLHIPFVEVSFVKDYWNEVFTQLLEDYERGFTPNPDVLCNKYIKFGSFYQYARNQLEADAIATGHYAHNSFGPFLEKYGTSFFEPGGEEKAHLCRAVDVTKDQTLFLSEIKQEALQKSMFPLGPLYKYRVRQLAQEFGMEKLSKKRDSVGICFIGDRQFSDFIAKYIEDRPGVFIDVDTGNVLGKHSGVHQFTIGQRCRLPGCRHPYYVCGRDAKTQTILAAQGRDHPSLYSRRVIVSIPHWISYQPQLLKDKPFSCMFKFQHTEWTIPCSISLQDPFGFDSSENNNIDNNQFSNENVAVVELAIPTRAITPGQQAVFYKGSVCLGSSKILSSDALLNSVSSDILKMCSSLFIYNNSFINVNSGKSKDFLKCQKAIS